MADKENKRKCFMCGCSPATDNVKLFRFPKPAIRNLIRCELWAKFMYPNRENHPVELQKKLHNDHRMLCQRHFKASDFVNNNRKLLLNNSVPSVTIHNYPIQPIAGPSRETIQLLDITNVNTNTLPVTTAVSMQIDNINETQLHYPSQEPKAGSSQSKDKKCVTAETIPMTFEVSKQVDNIIKDRERNNILYEKCRKNMQKICRLHNKIKKMKSKDILKIISEENCVKKLASKLTPAFALILQGQIRNFKKKVNGWRWAKEEKIIALRIFKRSPTCYRLLRRLFHLPSPNTLKTLLNKVPFNIGTHGPVLKLVEKYLSEQKQSDNHHILMFDEMSIKKNLSYNSKDDIIEGFQDHGFQGRSPLTAGYALVFMIAGIRKKIKQPIAHYFSSGFSTADRLAVLIKEVLHQCFQAGINISAIVCDMDGVNRRALSILGASVDNPCITVEDKEIVTLFDPPHLLKCFRNLFMKYDIECVTDFTNENVTGRGIAKWSHIKEFFELDNNNPNFVFAPALKKDHFNPNTKQKMKVNLAAQVFSHSVAAGMYTKISTGELPASAAVTANVVANIDKLFDGLNSDSSDLRRGKPYATNMSRTSPHLDFFRKMRHFFKNLKYVGSPRNPPSQEGWIWTLNGVEKIWKKFNEVYKISRLATRRLQQDPLENLFGCIRGNCGSNTNPTCGQFVAGLKTSLLSNLSHIAAAGNCESDANVLINNFNTLLLSSQPTHISTEPEFDYFEMPSTETIIEDDCPEMQACAYVCGFIMKRFPTECIECKKIFLSEKVEAHHSFVEYREYSDIKKSLNYVAKTLVDCVECCASIVNAYLKEKGHENNLKRNIKLNIETSINFNFLNTCQNHAKLNVNNIINSVFAICVKRFCVLQNRKFSEEASASALKRKMNIILHK